MNPNEFYESVRLHRKNIQQIINQKIINETSLELAMNRLFIHFKGNDKRENGFDFVYHGVGYEIYHDKYDKRIYLSSMMEMPKNIDAIAV